MSDFQPIDTYKEELWDSEWAEFRGPNGELEIGRYGYEDESWDGEDEYIWGAYHGKDDVTALKFDPVEWRPVEEPY